MILISYELDFILFKRTYTLVPTKLRKLTEMGASKNKIASGLQIFINFGENCSRL
jgi:hypothetical protein